MNPTRAATHLDEVGLAHRRRATRPSTARSPAGRPVEPADSDSSVVLPEPDRPRTATSSPRSTRRSTSATAWTTSRPDLEVAAQAAGLDHRLGPPASRRRGRVARSLGVRPAVGRLVGATSRVVAGARSSGQTPTWSSSSSSRTRLASPSASTCARGSCSRPARSRTAYSVLMTWWSPSPETRSLAERLAADPPVADGDRPVDLLADQRVVRRDDDGHARARG